MARRDLEWWLVIGNPLPDALRSFADVRIDDRPYNWGHSCDAPPPCLTCRTRLVEDGIRRAGFDARRSFVVVPNGIIYFDLTLSHAEVFETIARQVAEVAHQGQS